MCLFRHYPVMEKLEENSSSQLALNHLKGLESMTQFPLIQALAGRRSRRFCVGAEIPDGPLAFQIKPKTFSSYRGSNK